MAATMVALIAPSSAHAKPRCEIPASSPVFTAFGDTNQYFLAAGGSFDPGPGGWITRGQATIVPTTHAFALKEGPNPHAMRLRNGASVTSPKLCVTPDTPHLRFLARYQGDGQLDVEVRVYSPSGRVTDSSSGSISPSDHGHWAPSRFVDLKTDAISGHEGYVDVRFYSQGDWLIDDVYIDPRVRM